MRLKLKPIIYSVHATRNNQVTSGKIDISELQRFATTQIQSLKLIDLVQMCYKIRNLFLDVQFISSSRLICALLIIKYTNKSEQTTNFRLVRTS